MRLLSCQLRTAYGENPLCTFLWSKKRNKQTPQQKRNYFCYYNIKVVTWDLMRFCTILCDGHLCAYFCWFWSLDTREDTRRRSLSNTQFSLSADMTGVTERCVFYFFNITLLLILQEVKRQKNCLLTRQKDTLWPINCVFCSKKIRCMRKGLSIHICEEYCLTAPVFLKWRLSIQEKTLAKIVLGEK